MIINEVAQWAILAFIAVFVLGLTRQLGLFMQTGRQRSVTEDGPPIGRPLPDALLATEDREVLSQLMHERGTGWGVLVSVDQGCPGCEALIERLGERGVPGGAPVAMIARQADDPTFRARVDEVADLVLVAPERLNAADMTAAPTVVIFDADFEAVHKEILADVPTVVEHWGGASPHSASLTVEHLGASSTPGGTR